MTVSGGKGKYVCVGNQLHWHNQEKTHKIKETTPPQHKQSSAIKKIKNTQ